MKRLPLGIQTFSEIINGNMLYVDKTRFVPAMTERYKYVFLSRPRRFGKSLFVSVLDSFFSGEKELFKGLQIYDYTKWENHPVIRLDFSTIAIEPGEFEKLLSLYLRSIAKKFNVPISSDSPQFQIYELIDGIAGKTGKSVVILVDEYDKPIVDFIDIPEKAALNRDHLRKLFASIKSLDQNIRFMFITGVSKFSKVSLFSGMNQIVDISLNPDFAEIMGYSTDEIENCFDEYINNICEEIGITRSELLRLLTLWYNGYSWDGSSKVFNPFSVLNFFDSKKFDNFWFSSGTPAHLTKLFRQNNFDISKVEKAETRDSAFNTDDLSKISLLSMLFQTGYLTVKSTQTYSGVITYTVDYPNHEVKDAIYRLITSELLNNLPESVSVNTFKVKESLEAGNTDLFLYSLKELFAQIPSNLFIKEEKYFHSLFIMIMYMSGIDVDSEVNTNLGRIDGVMETKEKIYIVEFKYEKTPGIALEQIHAKKYYEKYSGKGKQIILVGVNFSRENISMVTESV